MTDNDPQADALDSTLSDVKPLSLEEFSSADQVSGTAFAPSCPSPIKTDRSKSAPSTIDDLLPGERLDDFEVIALLGRGAFGAVYLARQISLDREVALKVTALQADEGRKMARLEHEHIVQVFSETATDTGARLLCMQFVPGPTLQEVLDSLAAVPICGWNGALLLETIDRLTSRPTMFDPAAARNREVIANLNWVETVCWIGARLAEALDYAHSRGVLHRDIKPGNIMLSQFGRPLLVDFNLAFQQIETGPSDDRIGGTLAYMAPEHLDAFVPDSAVPPEAVGQAADIYSLGVVLYQTACGKLPFIQPKGQLKGDSRGDVLRAIAAQRREAPPPLPAELPIALNQVIARCMNPVPEKRYATGRELSAALEGCRHFDVAQREMPDFGRMRAYVLKHPFVWLAILGLAPQVVASFLNIAYNTVQIISELTPAQQSAFGYIVLGYNIYGYLTGIVLATLVIMPVYRVWKSMDQQLPADRTKIDAARRMATTWPTVAALTSCLGWLPGGVVFPLCLMLVSGSLPAVQWAHFFFSFTVSGLIALTYSTLTVQWLVLCVIYPRMWADWAGFRTTAATELRAVPSRLRFLQVLAGVIPLAGAALEIVGSKGASPALQVLELSLIFLGGAGFCLAMFAAALLSRALAALTGVDEISKKTSVRL